MLLLFGGGLAIGNLLGGKLADKAPMRAVIGTLVALAAVLAVARWAMPHAVAAVVFIGLLGIVAFATVAPLQVRVLEKAAGAGQNLASSLNIAAFNLGNALGAWAGGIALARGPGLAGLSYLAALLTALGLLIAWWSVRIDNRKTTAAGVPCAADIL